MKTYKYALIAIILVLATSTGWSGPKNLQEFTKHVSEEFSINPNGTVVISNKYGDVDIETSDRNTVSFEIDIIVEARNQERADEIMDKIKIDFSNSSSEVKARTIYDFGTNWNWGKKNESYKVHYTVKMPKDVDLELSNKYGDISSASINGDLDIYLGYGSANLQDIGGDVEADLAYVGSFDAGDIGGDLDLTIKYSDFKIGDVSEVDITSKYSDLTIGATGEVTIESKYDQYEIDKATSVDILGKYDDYEIGHCDFFEIDTKYTQVRIESLKEGGDFDTKYGSVRVRELHDGFDSFMINSEHTGYNIGITDGVRFNIDTKYTGIDLPNDLTFSYKEKDGNEYKLQGFYKSKNKGIIEAQMRYGHLDVSHRP